MAVYSVTLEINTAGSDSNKVIQSIKDLGIKWMQYTPNTVLLYSKDSAETLAKKIFKLITKSDYVLVLRVTKEYYGWMPPSAWEWLDKEVSYD